MTVPLWVWLATIAGIIGLFAADLSLANRHPHAVSVAEAARWVVLWVSLAVLFGLGVGHFSGGAHATEFFAGYVTEYSLSIDNLFVFIVIISAFGVPRVHQHKALLIGVLGSLVLRGLLIAAGSALVTRFEWVFFVFGGFLVATAVRLLAPHDENGGEYREPRAVRVLRRVLPLTDRYHGGALVARVQGRRYGTPMLVVAAALMFTDLVFAFDSIPAIFGLTSEPYLIVTANAFALLGLRQLYFMIGGLLQRLVYLRYGLAVVLAFIGVKLICEALAGSGVGWAPHVGTGLSLAVILGVLAVTTVASLLRSRRARPAQRAGNRS